MRLLQLHKHGGVSLTKNLYDDIPPYAILSHTWGADDEEVTFEDLTQGVGKDKAGYEKISFCEKQAAGRGLQHVWIDTCCIDKSNSPELSEALNSMFRWYSEADRCYVYLADVSERDWRVGFCNSRWFTRGWTLQELLAPSSVEFFSREGKRLGDKNSLGQQVSKITGIPTNALQGEPLSSFSVDARISWAENRQTKREEDKAYSLMGIVGVHMSPIYGEGEAEAFQRLRSKIDKRGSQQGKLLQVLNDKNWFDANTSTSQDESGTLLTIHPRGWRAGNIVQYYLNKERIMQDPGDASKQALRVTYDLPSRRKTKQHVLLGIGRDSNDNDMILPKEEWSKQNRCYFDLNPRTNELLLHDTSKRKNTSLRYDDGIEQLPNKEPRQCVVLQDRESIFRIGGRDGAEFLLKPWKVQNPELHAQKRQSFLSRSPEGRGPYEETLDQFRGFDVQSVASSVHNTRMNTPFQPELGNDIKYKQLRKLGDGSQCTVYEVVDMYNGDHLAARVFDKPILEKQFKQIVKHQLSLEMETNHKNILVPRFLQESLNGQTLTALYDVCKPSLELMIENFKSQEQRRNTTTKMVLDVTLALEFLHAQDIVHQNVKPSKILWRNGDFVLSGFGIAMVITSSHSVGGTDSYMHPERWPSLKGDIYRLGATAIECLEGFPKEEDRLIGQGWHDYLQTRAAGRPIASMLASDPKQRPTARELLDTYFPYSLPSREWSTTLSQDTPALPDGVLARLRDIDSTRHNKLGIARTKPANSTHQEREKSQKSSKPSRKRRKWSRRKQEMKGEGKDPLPRS